MYFLLGLCFIGFILPSDFTMLFLFCHCLPASLALCISLRNVQPGTKFRQAADEHSCRKGRRLHARHRLVPAPMASLPYRRTGDRWSGTSGRPFDQNSQRMGDLAAGTMVIKEKNYRKIHVSLDEFDYLTKDYRPTYPQASDLSLEQINVITRTLQSGKKDRTRRIASLAKKSAGTSLHHSSWQ